MGFLEGIRADFLDPFPAIAWSTALVRLVLAALLAGVIGFEREVKNKPAGLRTHMLISVAACLFALLAFELIELEGADGAPLRADPLRLVEAVTAGVAFLAAGTIITGQGAVKGLTTGAAMWLAGAIGLAVGVGQGVLAAMAVGVILVILAALRLVER